MGQNLEMQWLWFRMIIIIIGMWATAELIEKVGCDNVLIECAATDVDFVLGKYTDEGTHGRTVNLDVAHTCLQSKCP